MKKDTQSRKYFLTLNNPTKHGFTSDVIKEKMAKFRSLQYFCFSYELGAENQTEHVHIFAQFKSSVRFSTMLNAFPIANIQNAKATAQECRAYIEKSGKWTNSEKASTSVQNSFFEAGELVEQSPGHRSELECLYLQIKNGASDYEILENNPRYLRHINLLDKARLAVAKEMATAEYLPVTVTYIYGDHGVGKTRFVLNNFDCIFRSTVKKNIFDNYSGQDVLFLDSYFNNIPLDELLLYTEGFKSELTCRYCNKYSNWQHIILASTKPITDQYKDDQYNNPDAWRAFLRRVTTIIHFLPSGEKVYYKVDDGYNVVPIDLDPAPDFPGGSPSV